MQGALMLGVAVAIDGIQILLDMVLIGLVLDSFLSIFAWLIFWFWFKLNGVSFLKGKTALLRLVAISIGGIIEIIPLINDIPTWLFAVGIMLLTVRLEDKAQNMGIGKVLSFKKLSGGKSGLNANKNGRMNKRYKKAA